MREAIDSAIAQTYQNIEIIVVNDGSNDNGKTREIALSYGDKIRYFEKENGGVSTALNLGIKEMRGEYFSWLSHDDVYYPNKISRQIEELNKLEDKKTIIFSSFKIKNEFNSTTYIANSLEKISNIQEIYEFEMLDIFFSSKLNGCTLLIAKDLFIDFGLFDIKKRTTQDYELWINFYKNNVKYFYINEPLILSRHHKMQDTHKINDIHIKELNDLYIYTFNLFKNFFQKLPLWQLDFFLEIMINRGLYKVYTNILTEYSNGPWNKDKMTIWLYWESNSNEIPNYIKLCWKTIIHHNKQDFQIKIINDDTIKNYLKNINEDYKLFKQIAHKADYIRFCLLNEHGGIWLDSDTLCLRSLEPIKQKIEEKNFVCMGYNEKDDFFPLIAFLGSKPRNKILYKVIEVIEKTINLKKTQKLCDVEWDEIGGYNLKKNLLDTNETYFFYNDSFFSVKPCHTENMIEDFLLNNHDIYELNHMSFAQSISASVSHKNLASLSQSDLIYMNNFIGYLFRLSFFGIKQIDDYQVKQLEIFKKEPIKKTEYYFLGIIPIISAKYKSNNLKIKLFKFINIFQSKKINNKTNLYVFGVNILKIKTKMK
jgi:glycosyltransferase involved in cell wall biosynthesis